MNELEGHYAQGNPPETERQILCNTTDRRNLRRIGTEQRGGFQGLGGGGQRDFSRRVRSVSSMRKALEIRSTAHWLDSTTLHYFVKHWLRV